MIEYTLVRSDRRTLSLRIMADGKAEVRAPRFMPKSEIDRFVSSKETWIDKTRKRLAEETADAEADAQNMFTPEDIRRMGQTMVSLLPPLLRKHAPALGVNVGRVTVRMQKTRWGSCSSKGNLNFNCLLAEAPPSVLEYVVIHELCHRIEMNHSRKFWALVEGRCQDYRSSVAWLKTEGRILMSRAGLR